MSDSANEPYVRPDVATFLKILNALNAPKSHEVGEIAARAAIVQNVQLSDLPVGTLGTVRDLDCPGPGGHRIRLRLFDPRETRGPGPVVMFFHGGGWVLGDLDTHASVCTEIARTLDLPVVAVDYRLAPEHRWPAAPDDAEAAARWVAGAPAELGRAATGLVLTGDSAGGTLTIVTALALRDQPAQVPVLVQAPIYPAVDHGPSFPSYQEFGDGFFMSTEGMAWFSDCYAADLQHWRGAPLKADQAGMPPTLVMTASLDPLRDQGRAYAAKTIAAGVPTVFREAKGNIHGFVNLRQAVPSSQGDLAGFLVQLKAMIGEAEGARSMAQAAGAAGASAGA